MDLTMTGGRPAFPVSVRTIASRTLMKLALVEIEWMYHSKRPKIHCLRGDLRGRASPLQVHITWWNELGAIQRYVAAQGLEIRCGDAFRIAVNAG